MTVTIKTAIEHDGITYDAELCVITDTFLGMEDHGIFTLQVGVDIPVGGHTSIGGYSLDGKPKDNGGPRLPTTYGMAWIMEVIKVVVGSFGKWEDLPRRKIYVLFDHNTTSRNGFEARGLVSTDGKGVLIFSDISKRWGSSE